MDKQELIKRFKDACNKPVNRRWRIHCIFKQQNRDFWGIFVEGGIAKISKRALCIYFWQTSNNAEKKEFNFMAYLTKSEYDELEMAFFGDLKQDKGSMRKIGDVSQSNKALYLANFKSMNLIYMPIGVGFGTLIAIGTGCKLDLTSYIIFISSVILWLAHVTYKKLSK